MSLDWVASPASAAAAADWVAAAAACTGISVHVHEFVICNL
jgi:hypothetical protein